LDDVASDSRLCRYLHHRRRGGGAARAALATTAAATAAAAALLAAAGRNLHELFGVVGSLLGLLLLLPGAGAYTRSRFSST